MIVTYWYHSKILTCQILQDEEDSEGGAFYPGDEEKSYVSFGLIVNAWMPLPTPYRLK